VLVPAGTSKSTLHRHGIQSETRVNRESSHFFLQNAASSLSEQLLQYETNVVGKVIDSYYCSMTS
jgi:hypothetical protein